MEPVSAFVGVEGVADSADEGVAGRVVGIGDSGTLKT